MPRKPNRWGCVPSEDVCPEHSEPLVCRHGCSECKAHQCKERDAIAADRAHEAFDAGFNAGLAHARQWRKLTSDPKTWPEEGDEVLFWDGESRDVVCWTEGMGATLHHPPHWTHWLPLPPAPPDEAETEE